MTRSRTAWGAAAGAALLTAAVLATSPAQAAPASDTGPRQVESAAAALGGTRTAGSWLSGGKLTVAVTDAAAARAVTAAGGTARVVARSLDTLERHRAALEAPLSAIPGTAWSVDARTNQVLVQHDSRVTGAQLARLRAAVAAQGGAARLEAVGGTFGKLISGGQSVYNAGGTCSLGFNVRRGTTYYFLTAGHCTALPGSWYQNAARTTLIGPRAGGFYPGNDFGLVRHANAAVSRPGNVFLYNGSWQDIASAANPRVGQAVQRSGRTTGLRSGTVTGLNATVNYGNGEIVKGLIRTDVCAEPGDSGGPLFNGTVAYGLTSGGNGNCTLGGTTFFQPVVEALDHYGVSIF